MPACPSVLTRARAIASTAKSSELSSVRAATPKTSSFAAAMAAGAEVRICEIFDSTRASNAGSCETTCCISPIFIATGARNRSPVMKNSRARPGPTRAITNGEMMAGMIPSFTSVKPNCTDSIATPISHAATSPSPPAERRAMDPGDHGLRTLGDGEVHLPYGAGVGKVLLVCVLNHALHPVQIGAGAERLTIAGEDNDAHFITPAEFGEGLGHLPREFIIKCVMDFRAVQNDKSDTLVDIDLQHGSYIRNTPNRVSSCGAFLAAEIPRPRTIRVSKGSMTPSSQRRAVLKYALLSSAYLSSVGFMNSCCSAAVIVLP